MEIERILSLIIKGVPRMSRPLFPRFLIRISNYGNIPSPLKVAAVMPIPKFLKKYLILGQFQSLFQISLKRLCRSVLRHRSITYVFSPAVWLYKWALYNKQLGVFLSAAGSQSRLCPGGLYLFRFYEGIPVRRN